MQRCSRSLRVVIMSPLAPEQQLSHAWRNELPGVTLYYEEDLATSTARYRAEAHISSATHNLTRERLIQSNGEAARDAVEQIGAEMRDKALDAFGLHVVIQRMRHEGAMKYEAVAAQLDVAREANLKAAEETEELPGVSATFILGQAAGLRMAAAAIRAAHAQPTRGTR